MSDGKIPEIIDVAVHRRERKLQSIYEEMFEHLPRRQVPLDILPMKERTALSVEQRLHVRSLFFILQIWSG